MSMEKLLDVFGQDASAIEDNIVNTFDWSQHSIHCVYVIFITGRCGSTWLTHLLEDSGLCGHPHELFNETMMPRFNRTVNACNFREYFTGLVANFSSAGTFGFKIDEFRFRQLLPLIDFTAVFPASNTKFFWMTRRDIVDQAFSYARAKATGHWHDFANQPTEGGSNIELSDKHLWKEIVDLLAKETRMQAFFKNSSINPVNLTYEDMTADRLLTVMKVMLELGCNPAKVEAFIEKMEDKTLKLDRGNKYRILGAFCSKYKALLRDIEENRNAIDFEAINKRLLLDFDLQV